MRHLETVHPPVTRQYPLPCNVARREDLPADAGWWGYSFRDVPSRADARTFIATLHDAVVLPCLNPDNGEFFPAVLDGGRRVVTLPQIDFRRFHRPALHRLRRARRLRRATWVMERVYDNHSHWLTAHLPKLRLLAGLDRLEGVLFPRRRTAVMDASLRRLGLDAADYDVFDEEVPLRVDELTVIGTDRFRSDLLRPVREAMAMPVAAPWRRVFISRGGAARRKLLNEEAIWRVLRGAGFERACMEQLDFDAQVKLMGETRVLAAPHGAGLTNMLFCAPGTQVVELADLSFPNPNFYALASALGHDYWLIAATAHGDCHPLYRDLCVAPDAVGSLLPAIEARLRGRAA